MAEKRMPGVGPVTTTVGADEKTRTVILAFSSPIDRMEMSPEEAENIASILMSRAKIARNDDPKGTGEPG